LPISGIAAKATGAATSGVASAAASGVDLAQELSRLRPELPVVISSGYVSEELRDGARRARRRPIWRW
jgi:hypothetical protein